MIILVYYLWFETSFQNMLPIKIDFHEFIVCFDINFVI